APPFFPPRRSSDLSVFTTIPRSHTAEATRDPTDLTARAVRLLEKTDAGRRPVRLLGVSLHNFTAESEVDGTALPFGGTEDTKETKDTKDTTETTETEDAGD